MSQEQQHFKTWRTARTGDLKTQTDSQVLGISERLLDAHALRIQPDDGGGAQMPQPQTRYQEPGLAGGAGAFGARTSHAPDAVDVKPMSSFPRAFGKYRAHHDRVAANVEANAQIGRVRAGAGIPVTRRNPGPVLPQLQTVASTDPSNKFPALFFDHLEPGRVKSRIGHHDDPAAVRHDVLQAPQERSMHPRVAQLLARMHFFVQRDRAPLDHHTGAQQLPALIRSEEHTSELQSR